MHAKMRFGKYEAIEKQNTKIKMEMRTMNNNIIHNNNNNNRKYEW